MIRTMLLLGGITLAAPLMAQTADTSTQPATAPAATAATAPATGAATVTAGATVSDPQGGAVGTIESVSNGLATLSTGTNKVQVPVGSFAKGQTGLVFAMTKAEVDAKAGAASAAASAPLEIAVGATVADQTGAKVGTVKAVAGNLVTVASETASAQLPKTSFAKGPNGLVIAMSPAQFEAAAKAAGGAKSASAS